MSVQHSQRKQYDIRPSPQQLTSIDISEDVVSATNKIAPNAAAGPDGSYIQLLKRGKIRVSFPTTTLENISRQEEYQDILKTGIVMPIYKGGDKGLAKNYRLVLLHLTWSRSLRG